MATNKQSGTGGAGSSAIGTAYKSGETASHLKEGRPDSELVYNGDPGNPSVPADPSLSDAKGGTEKKYQLNGFDPSKEVSKFSYTSGRVAKRVYNTYEKNGYQVFGYYTDWSQYDGRYENKYGDNEVGRGIDLMLLDNNGTTPIAYDKIVIGFAGIVGDKGEKGDTINKAVDPSQSVYLNRTTNQATFTDPWADVLSFIDVGFSSWVSNDANAMYGETKAQGVLGGLYKLKQRNPDLKVALSIGGWTMSEAFHWVARDDAKRATFVASVIDIFKAFPTLFTEIDIDWEYPGAVGNMPPAGASWSGNTYSDDDEVYYRKLIADLRTALDNAGHQTVLISIAAVADVEKMKKANFKGMIDAGVWGINLMTYDFFGTPWAPKLAHHSNLHRSHPNDDKENSIHTAVDYLESIGVPLNQVFIGYAAYSRSGKGAQITSYSPLEGTYDTSGAQVTGSFESGVTEWYDLIYNYIDLENQTEGQKGRLNGFHVYSDQVADADYLYNPDTKLFMSIDTPRSVKAKGDYVQQRGLGGLFTWTIEMDNGVLVNAAREGLGNTVTNQVVDMSPFYFWGENVKESGPKAVITPATLEVNEGDTINLSGKNSTGYALTFAWSAPGLSFDGATSDTVSGIAPTTGKDTTYPVSLTVTDSSGLSNTATAQVKVKVKGGGHPPVAIAALQLTSGTPFTLSGSKSYDPDNEALTYQWTTSPALPPVDGATTAEVSGTVPTVTQATDYYITLTVSDSKGNDQTSLYLEAIPSGDTVKAVITGSLEVQSGAQIALSGKDSTGTGSLTYLWTASGLPFNNATTPTVSGTAPTVDTDTSYPISLKVTDANNNSDTANVTLVVKATGGGTWNPKTEYPGGSEVTHNYTHDGKSGLGKFKAKWDAAAGVEPGKDDGNTDWTSGQTGYGEVWWFEGDA